MSNYDMGKLVEDNPTIRKRRSYIPYMKHTAQIDFNAGLLVPCDKPIEVLPGDSFKLKHSLKLRMTNPPKVPVLDQLVFDLYFFYTPLRILWDNFDKFITGDTGTDWTKISDLTIPILALKDFAPGSLTDFLGCYTPTISTAPEGPALTRGVNALPFRAYYSIWNHFFRFESLQSEVYFATGDNTVVADVASTVATNIANYYSGNLTSYMSEVRSEAISSQLLMPVNKLPDYFTRSLPAPQAGPDVSILGLDFSNAVIGSSNDNVDFNFDTAFSSNNNALKATGSLDYTKAHGLYVPYEDVNYTVESISGPLSGFGITGNTIRDLRQAFAIDQLLTLDARYGRRINEYSIGHYGVNVPDYRIDFPEFLSHRRIYINVNQVIQSSASEVNSPQGNVGAWSETTDRAFDFTKSFVEHGYIMSVCCVRILNRTYSQGIDRLWSRYTRFDFYDPVLANISDTPVYTTQLYNDVNDEDEVGKVFGYQEAWAEYKYQPNHIANHMRPQVSNTLAVWNYAEQYSQSPTLSEEWLIEDITPINRTMYLTASNTVSQFLLDIYYDYDVYRTMPLHTLPGSLTHSW